MIKNLLSRLKTGPQACLRPLVLDMDWYRWDLGPFWKKLPKAPEFNRQFRYQRLRQDEVITAAIRGEARSYTKRRISSINNVIDLEYKGLNLWQIARGCILAHANVPHQKYLTTDHLEKTIEIISSVITVIDSLPAWFNLLNPHAVIVYEGTRSLSRAIIEIARQNRIKTVAIANNSLRPGYLFFDSTTGMIVNRHRMAKCGREILEARIFTESQREHTFQTWLKGCNRKMAQHTTGGIDTPKDICEQLKLNPDKPIALLLAHVRNDTSVLYDSPLYEDSVDFITSVIDLFRSEFKDWTLVVKLHPKEEGGNAPGGYQFNQETKHELAKRGYTSEENIYIVADKKYNTQTLMQISKIGITEVSQSGLEMAILGKPVIAAGSAFYGAKGFTWDLSHPITLQPLLADAMKASHNHQSCEQVKKLALNFMTVLFFEELVADDLSENSDKIMRVLEGL